MSPKEPINRSEFDTYKDKIQETIKTILIRIENQMVRLDHLDDDITMLKEVYNVVSEIKGALAQEGKGKLTVRDWVHLASTVITLLLGIILTYLLSRGG